MQTGISSRARAMSIAAGAAGGATRRGATGETMLGSGGQRKRGGDAPAMSDDTTKRTRRGAFTDAVHARGQAAGAGAAEGAAAAQAAERTSLGRDRDARWEQDLRDVLAGLAMCEQRMSQTRKACRADSEALRGKCSAVLESIAALQLVASKFLHEENACVGWSGTRHAHVLAGAEWFRDMAQTMSAVRDVMSRSQAQLVDTAARKQADDIRRTTVAWPSGDDGLATPRDRHAVIPSEEPCQGDLSISHHHLSSVTSSVTSIPSEEPRQGDLLAIVQRMHAMALDLSEVERASATSLRACAIGAAEWACAASDELRYAGNSRSLLPVH